MGRKVSDEQFFACLRKAAGLYSKTSRLIKKEFNIEYTRQAVRDRALNSPEILNDIREESKDIAEEGVQASMRSKDERVRYKACVEYLTMQGRDRGYIIKHDVVNEGGEIPIIIEVTSKKKAKEIGNFLDSIDE